MNGKKSLDLIIGAFVLALCACSTTATKSETSPAAEASAVPEASPEPSGMTWRIAPAELGFDPDAAAKLIARAQESRSDGLVVIKDGAVVLEWPPYAEQTPIETMSVTKSLVSLGVGPLVDDGLLDLSAPVATWFNEWADTPKAAITLEHLLAHTSGLAAPPTPRIYEGGDFVGFALRSSLETVPGARWSYNNNASNLIPAVVQRATGRDLESHMKERMFEPLGITEWGWSRDGHGALHGMAGLQLKPTDLARLGQLVLDRGVHGGKQLVSADWVERSTAPNGVADFYGFGWWMEEKYRACVVTDDVVAQWRVSGVPDDFVQAVQPIVGKELSREAFFDTLGSLLGGDEGLERWSEMTWRAGRPECTRVGVEVVGTRADGWLGQFVVIVPEHRLVVVRMMRWREGVGSEKDDVFGDLPKVVAALTSPPGSAQPGW